MKQKGLFPVSRERPPLVFLRPSDPATDHRWHMKMGTHSASASRPNDNSSKEEAYQ